MKKVANLAKLIGITFYKPIKHEQSSYDLIHVLCNESIATPLLTEAFNNTTPDQLHADYQQLFEGCEKMPAPPWGSVYLDRERVLFGNSTLKYRQFLTKNALQLDTGIREPEDQFGLMLLALASLIESQASQQVIEEFLAVHLLPWAYYYLSLVEQHSQTEVYRLLARSTRQWLQQVEKTFGVVPEQYCIYFK